MISTCISAWQLNARNPGTKSQKAITQANGIAMARTNESKAMVLKEFMERFRSSITAHPKPNKPIAAANMEACCAGIPNASDPIMTIETMTGPSATESEMRSIERKPA